jgi:hypothetical protein
MLAYNLMSVFRQAVIRQKAHQTLSTLHHKVLAMGAYWGADKEGDQKPTLNLAVARKRRPWFKGLWANANEPVTGHIDLSRPNGKCRINIFYHSVCEPVVTVDLAKLIPFLSYPFK